MPATRDGIVYDATPQDLDEASSRVILTEQSVHDRLMELMAYVQAMDASWGGAAHLQFVELMREFDSFAQHLRHSLEGIGHGLQGAGVNVRESEQAALTGIQSVQVPAARLT